MQTATRAASTTVLAAARNTPQATFLHLGISLLQLQLVELMRSPVFTVAEQDTATARVYQTTDATQLLRWKKNVSRVKEEREAPAPTPVDQPSVAGGGEVAGVTTQRPLLAPVAEQNATQLQRWQRSQVRQGNAQTAARQATAAGRYGWLSSSDVAAELAAVRAEQEFTAETGHTWADVASL